MGQPKQVSMARDALVVLGVLSASPAFAAPPTDVDRTPQARAAATVAAMTPDERTVLTHGIMPLKEFGGPPPPADSIPGAGYVAGIPRLHVPALRETDASLGVAYVNGTRHDGATALPAGVAMAASWNPDLLRAGGAMIAGEARAKGFNVLLAGGANLTRDPRNGRTFEYLAEDPLLTGMLVGAAIDGIQSAHMIATIKHFALNGQETGRKIADSRIGEAAARESDLLAFEIGIERGHPGAVMCAYNSVNGAHACDSDWLLNQVLKRDWGYDGFVLSDWGAVPGVDAALHGLDQQSGSQLDPTLFFGDTLAGKAAGDPAWRARVADMNRRIVTQIYAHHLDSDPAVAGGTIDFARDGAVALETARQGIVLLRNQNDTLPLAAGAGRIAVIGGYANSGVLSGGGSSQVDAPGGPAVVIPLSAKPGIFAQMHYQGGAPLAAIAAAAPGAHISWSDGSIVADAVMQAKRADIAIIFAPKWASEGADQADLSLPNGMDALIEAVASVNPHTIVVLETGNPVAMPWLGKVAAVLEAWYPGARGGEAIADVLFGRVDPSGHLPITFPASVAQLPRPVLDGYAELEPNFAGDPPHTGPLAVDYTIEGSDVGYRWFARQGLKPLFPFGFGLSYTSFANSGLKVAGDSASLTIRNTGGRAGADVAQLYLVARAGRPIARLVGFARVDLAAGESRTVTLPLDPRLLADWQSGGWAMPAGDYAFALGTDAATLGQPVTVHLAARQWRP